MIHCFKLCGYNIVLDVASGSIHCVDDLAYDVIVNYELIIDGKDRSVLVNRVQNNHKEISVDDIQEVINDIEALRNRVKLFSPDKFKDVTKSKYNAPLSALCLNVSHACNMSCAYCFAGTQSDGSSMLAPEKNPDEPISIASQVRHWENASVFHLMSLETGKQAIDFLVSNSGDKTNLDVDFFGGEPLLNFDVVKDIVRYAREIERNSNKKFRFTLTTNGLLIDDDVINFTNNQMKNVVLSLDGRPEVHDAMRKLPDGTGSYSNVIGKIKELVETRRGKGYYIRSTFTNKNTDFVNDILHIADLGFKEISMEPVVTKNDDTLGLKINDLPEIFKQYETLAVEMRRRDKLKNGFNFYHFNLDLTGGPCVHKRIAGCGVGTEYMAVTPDGGLYPCHQFIGNPEFLMGDVWRGVINKKLRDNFSSCSIYSRTECRDCWARFYCSGGCAANAYFSSGNINGIYKIGCELFKKRIECAIMIKVANEM